MAFKARVLSLDGKASGEMSMPAQFDEPLRPDVVRRAVHAEHTRFYQPKGSFELAGLQSTAAYYGRRHAWRQIINTGRSRLPRTKIAGGRSGDVRIVPHAVKGRRAHPPKPQKVILERINLKERNLAVRSAAAATIQMEVVKARGHQFNGVQMPLVIDSSFESINKAKEAKAILEKIGLTLDLERAASGRRMRSGRSRLRKGGYRTPKSALIVIGTDKGLWRAARNIPGVDVVKVENLTADDLAPGGDLGRLTVWTVDALKRLETEKLYC